MLKKATITIFCFLIFPFSCLFAQTYAEQYERCRKAFNITDSTPVSALEMLLKSMDSCLTGSNAPDFRAKTMEGDFVELSKLKGRVVVINFWAIGCSPCVREIPPLNALVKLYSGRPVSFISLADDDSGSLKKFLRKNPFKFSVIPESNKIMSDTFKLMSIFPYSIIIDKEGKIFKMWVGGFGSEKEVIPFYQNLIEQVI